MNFRAYRFLAVFLSFSAALQAQTNLSSDLPIEFDGITNTLVARQNATFVHEDLTLIADEIRFSKEKNEATATGNVRLNLKGSRLVAAQASYDLTTKQFSAADFRMGFFPYMITGKHISGTSGKFVIRQATVHTSQTGSIQPNLYVTKMTLRPGDRTTGVNVGAALLKAGAVPLLPLPFLNARVPNRESFEFETEAGHSGRNGLFLRTESLYSATERLRVGANLDYYSKRGFLVGPRVAYKTPTSSTSVDTGYISDSGERGEDVRDIAIGEERGFVELKHKQTLSRVELTAQSQYWSDSEVLRDFRPGAYGRSQAPESFVEAVLPLQDAYLSLFAGYDPNNFDSVTEKLPELRIDRLPTALGHTGVYWSFYNSFSHREREALDYNRYDGILTFDRPTALKPWWQFTPVVSGRYTYYDETTSTASSVDRGLWMLGFDSQWSLFKNYDVQAPLWEINGLKHLVQPIVQYRYMPRASAGSAEIPAIDARVFDTNLRPTDFFYMANADQLDSLNLVRFGLKQSLLTRNPKGRGFPTRELLTLELYQDYNFETPATTADAHPRWDSFYILSEASPCAWLSFGVFARLNWDEQKWQEHRLYATLRDGDYRSATFSSRYLEDDIHQYALFLSQKLTDRLTLFADMTYDVELHELSDAFYGLQQRLRSGWLLQYGLQRRTNDSRDSDTRFTLRFRWLNF